MAKTQKMALQTLALGAMLTALVIVLQLLGSFIRFGVFSISLCSSPSWWAPPCADRPSAHGSVSCSASQCCSAATPRLFWRVGTRHDSDGAGQRRAVRRCAGFIYRWLSKKNVYLGVFAAAIVCPVVNTGVFLLGCLLFFLPTITAWPAGTARPYGSTSCSAW